MLFCYNKKTTYPHVRSQGLAVVKFNGHLEHHGWISVSEKEKAYKFNSYSLSNLVESFEEDLKEQGCFELEDNYGMMEYESYQVLESEIITKRVVPISEILKK